MTATATALVDGTPEEGGGPAPSAPCAVSGEGPVPARTTAVVVDAMAAFGQGMASLLEDAGIAAVHAVPVEATAVVRAAAPDVLLLAGLDAETAQPVLAAARRARPDARVVLVTAGPGAPSPALRAATGARHWASRQDSLSAVLEAVRGRPTAPARAAHRPRRTGALSALTGREREVLATLTAGSSDAAIARRLGISPHTARTHVQNIMAKLDVHTRLEAATVGLRAGVGPAWAAAGAHG